jgi:hypothetical protein
MRFRLPHRGARPLVGCGQGRSDVKLGPAEIAVIERQRRRFVERFGREPGPRDPVFFDPESQDPRPINPRVMRDAVIDAAEKAGLDPVRVLQALKMRDCQIKSALVRSAQRRRG